MLYVDKKNVKRKEESDTYLNQVCRPHSSGEPGEKMNCEELSANTVASQL